MTRPIRSLVTAGNTREAIDDVRDWGNIFTGRTGRDIAVELTKLGPVHLLTSNATHAAELAGHAKLSVELFHDHTSLQDALAARMASDPPDAVFMTAAVADYRPAGVFAVESDEPGPDGTRRWVVRDVSAGKVSSRHDAIAVLGRATEKLVDKFRRDWGFRGFLVKFKLEVGPDLAELETIGHASRLASGADLLVANTLAMARGEPGTALILSPRPTMTVTRPMLAARLREMLTEWAASVGRPRD